LVVEILALYEAKFPEPDSRPCIAPVQWIQYQLDNFSTVEKVIASDSQIRIRPEGPQCHFLVCDRMGDSAIIEFIDGKMVCSINEKMLVKTITKASFSSKDSS
jgi:penicillin V acylase-like amidase (Ntn superfamily)